MTDSYGVPPHLIKDTPQSKTYPSYCEDCEEKRPAELAYKIYCSKHLKEANERNGRHEQSNTAWLAYITWLGSPDAERMPDGERFDCLIFAAQNAEKQVSQLLEAEKKRWREEVEGLRKPEECPAYPNGSGRCNQKSCVFCFNTPFNLYNEAFEAHNEALDAVLQKLS